MREAVRALRVASYKLVHTSTQEQVDLIKILSLVNWGTPDRVPMQIKIPQKTPNTPPTPKPAYIKW